MGDWIMATDYPDNADGNALRRLADSGADMSKPMDIDFFIAASDEATAEVVADKAAGLGYRTEICFDDDESLVDPWTCECTKAMVPTYEAVIAAQAELHAIARSLGAYTDGWGTFASGKQYTMTETEPMSAAPPPPRRRFQYSLRTLLLFVTAFAVLMAIIVTPTRTQRVAREIDMMHGSYGVTKVGPTWFRELFGRTIRNPENGWENTIVGPFDSLEWVELGFWRPPCDVHDEWLDNLAGHTSLKELELGRTHVTDGGMFRLRDLPTLRSLGMSSLPITDWSVAHIAAFTNIETLRLSDTRISGKTIFALTALPHLRDLDLKNTDVGDAAIPDLKDLRSLETLDLRGTKVTWAGASELESALPKCHIAHYPRSPSTQ